MDGQHQAAAEAEDARPMEIDELADDPDNMVLERTPGARQEELATSRESQELTVAAHDATAPLEISTTSTPPPVLPPVVADMQEESSGMGNEEANEVIENGEGVAEQVDELAVVCGEKTTPGLLPPISPPTAIEMQQDVSRMQYQEVNEVMGNGEDIVEPVTEVAGIHVVERQEKQEGAARDQPEVVENIENVVERVNEIPEVHPEGIPKEQQQAPRSPPLDSSDVPSAIPSSPRLESKLKEGLVEVPTSEEQPMEGVHEESTLIEPSGNDLPTVPPTTTSHIGTEVSIPESNELANEAVSPFTSLPTAVSEASPTSPLIPHGVPEEASDQHPVEQSTFLASNGTKNIPSSLRENAATTSLSAQPGSPSSDDPFNLKSGDGTFDDPVNKLPKDEPATPPGTDHPSHRFDEDGLADFSIPESWFAGVILPKLDRRTYRGYILADELKSSSGLKITLKRPDGWIAPKMEPKHTTHTGRRRRGGVGRQVEWLTKNQTDSDTVEDVEMSHSPSRRRRSKRVQIDADEADYDAEQQQGAQAEVSPSAARSGSVTSSQRERQGDGDDFLTDLSELDEIEARRKERAERVPTRHSGRIAVKEIPSMAEDQVSRKDGRHTGARRGRAAAQIDDEEIDELARSYSEDSMRSSPRPAKQKPKGRSRGKKVLNSDDDFEMLDEKAESDESNEEVDEDVLIYHRELCDKCLRPSAKDLLQSKKKRGGRKRKKQEFEEESGDEAERLMGWIECEKCTAAFHWSCLPGAIRMKALNEDKLLPRDEQIFRNGAPRKDDTLLLICHHCENELLANCMSCGTSDPLPQITPAGRKSQDEPPAETKTGTASAMEVDEVSDVKTIAQSNMDVDTVSAVRINGHVVAPEKADTSHTVQESSTVDEPVVIDSKSKSEKPQDQQMNSDKMDVAPSDTEKKTEVDTASDKDELEDMQSDTTEDDEVPLLFRCITCKRCAHYQHLPKPPIGKPEMTVEEAAAWYQEGELSQVYKCLDCRKWDSPPEYILGWRSTSIDEAEKKQDLPADALEDVKTPQKREYLVKWKGKAFRHATWVPHDYLSSVSRALLLSFLRTGMRVTLETESQIATKDSVLGEDTVEAVLGVDEDGKRGAQSVWRVGPPKADADAQDKIPVAWNTPDRILSVFLLKPAIHAMRRQALQNASGTPRDFVQAFGIRSSLEDGVKPADDLLISVEDAERTLKRKLTRDDAEDMVKHVGWAYVKWQDLQYEAATWDTPILPPSSASTAFLAAFQAYLWSRTVIVPVLKPLEAQKRDSRPLNGFMRMAKQPPCVVGGLEGLNWLMSKWHNLQSCILGKTVQIAAFLAYLGSEAYHVYPHLVVVPNSTLQNWTRELAKWAPHLRVVPYFGEKASRTVIREYELYHGQKDVRTLKTHVIVTTYEVITSKDFNVFARIPRWETLIVDEAQRLKAGSSLIFKKLNELNAVHKVLLTGTPLNNTIREILNLMNFLDPTEFGDLDAMEKRYSVPDEELYKELRAKIAPFMLRRSKEEVLDLPPKVHATFAIYVALTADPIFEVYRGILERNADLMEALARANRGDAKHGKAKRRHIHNMLMQLRKCIQHPFLCNDALEDYDLEATARHQALIDGSAKLGFLKAMLPKLRAKGHRVLLFSQFKIALDIIEQFFDGEDFKYLRLDGDTPQAKRQKDIDAFNAPDSPYSVFLLSTRAGGVGINLASADAVIIHDLDFNPHLDMQAIARSYRYGQKKTVMVYRLMMAQTVEANIMQASKKKLLLDHLIVQSLRKVEEEDDFATIVLNGAKAVFEDKAENDIVYSSESLDNMIAELEVGEKPEPQAKSTGFTFAPVYDTAQKSAGELPDLPEHSEPQDGDFWADVLKRMEAETKAREAELHGTGKRSRGKQISYADAIGYPNNSQEQSGPVEAQRTEDQDPKDAASQESDFIQEHSDISDAEQLGSIQAEAEELAGPLAKKARRVPPKLALHAANGDSIAKTGLTLDGGKGGERGVSSGFPDNDLMKKPRARPRKGKSSLADVSSQAAPGRQSASVSTQPGDKLLLAKAQILNLRYAAAECGIPDYVQRVQAILNVKMTPATRWDAYSTLASQVDEIFKSRGMAPIFSDSDVIRTVRPLFQEKGEDVRKSATSNGGAPKFHQTKPTSRPFTATQLTVTTPSNGASSSTWTDQSYNTAQTLGNPDKAALQSSTFPATATSAATTSALAVSRPMKRRKHAATASAVNSAPDSTQRPPAPVSHKRKKNPEPVTGPAVSCFFCTIQEFATKVQVSDCLPRGVGPTHEFLASHILSSLPKESQGSASDKAQWIKWLGDKEKNLLLRSAVSAASQSNNPGSTRPRPVPKKKRSSSLERKAKAEIQKDKEDQEVEALIGLGNADGDEIIEIDDSDSAGDITSTSACSRYGHRM
ncbi:hypothetical protein QFC22_001700 [Naganishia vaughanmartiniae]|uniref:Uncharacterized protein n=1 Tax=Naganishia vaughanmartiniae TaxID=1424756 RepID=A0ACC2XFW1_9TREE|nr:hypothetical protein QFC22_001700 [Naganishia vaughanmartiniae]